MSRKLYMSGMLMTLLLLSAIPSHSRVLHVKQDGSGDATTINGAFAPVQSGDTILVSPGCYRESLIGLSQLEDWI